MNTSTTRKRGWSTVFRWVFALALMLAGAHALTQPQVAGRAFDHLKTGFALTGVHVSAQCESCHVNGVFRGTPKDCVSCHISGNRISRGNVVITPTHMPTQQSCDSCHNTRSFMGARFDHMGIAAGSCASCHNGTVAKGKSPGHIPTQAACDSCHKSTSTWNSARPDHNTFSAATNCASCHDGRTASGKTGTHIPVGSTNCTSCHATTAWKPTRFNHTQVTTVNQCSTCHSGAYRPADGKSVTHTPYERISGLAIANCDTCHKAGFSSWTPARLHAAVTVSNQCATCHIGSKPNTNIHASVTGNCEACHKSTGNWSSASVDHSTFNTTTNCASCHNGSTATGKSGTHIPVGATNCIGCHATNTWRPSRFNHTQVTVINQCSTCHSGAFPPADGRTANHIPYQTLSGVAITNCDNCHKGGFAAWTPARFHGNVSVSTQCASCHNGSYPPAVAKPNTPTHVGVTTCESCHRSTTSWLTVVFGHSPANAVGTGTCDTCHNGTTAKGKTPTHIPVTTGVAKCDSCHRSQTSFATAVAMNHTVVSTATCKSCHNGSYVSQGTTGALAKPVNHIPEIQLLNGTSMDCKACHTSTTSWGSMRMNHNASLGGGAGWCKACHATGTNFLGRMDKKSPTHKTTNPPATDCSNAGCHRPLGNKGATFVEWD